ncbi:hypothetical protein B0H14DRAFT_2574132 [Mycena olivaceomarginata]|nr:hypothetical protein B0H14DRAFT_2574132 [Mycena olivaceomarginata]
MAIIRILWTEYTRAACRGVGCAESDDDEPASAGSNSGDDSDYSADSLDSYIVDARPTKRRGRRPGTQKQTRQKKAKAAKRFYCDLKCGASFGREADLKRHKETSVAHGGKKIPCKFGCKAQICSRGDAMLRHLGMRLRL